MNKLSQYQYDPEFGEEGIGKAEDAADPTIQGLGYVYGKGVNLEELNITLGEEEVDPDEEWEGEEGDEEPGCIFDRY